jgi:peptidoglycan/LPS O-acetylase OafA/YrhL
VTSPNLISIEPQPPVPTAAEGPRLLFVHPEARPKWRSSIGLLLGALALALAILPNFILPITHPTPPLNERVLGFAQELKDRAAALIKGKSADARASPQGDRLRWAQRASLAAAIFGVLAVIAAAWGYSRDESVKACAAALALGAAAVVLANLVGIATGILALLLFGGWVTV